MTKNILLLLFLLIPTLSYSQLKITKNEFPSYQGVVEMNDYDAETIYRKLKSWTALSYKSGKDVTQLEDDNDHKIIIKALGLFNYKVLGISIDGKYYYTMTLEARDGRFRFTINATDVIVGTDGQSAYDEIINKPNKKQIKTIRERIDGINQDLANSLSNLDNADTSNDEW